MSGAVWYDSAVGPNLWAYAFMVACLGLIGRLTMSAADAIVEMDAYMCGASIPPRRPLMRIHVTTL